MVHFSACCSLFTIRVRLLLALLLLALLLLALRLPAAAQAPAWQSARAVGVATAAATSNFSYVSATAVDAAGNVLLAGAFANTVTLGSTTLTSAGSADVFVAKFNPASNQIIWAQRAGGPGADQPRALAVSGSNVYVAGDFGSATADFGPTTLTNAGRYDAFIVRLIDAGPTSSFAWAQRVGGLDVDGVNALAVSGTNVYAAGYFQGLATGFGASTLTSLGSYDAFVLKLADTGGVVWAQRAGGNSNDGAGGLAVSGSNVYVAGYFSGTTAGFGASTLTTAGVFDVFVAKLTDAGPTGSFVWAQRAGGTREDFATALAVSGANVYVTGVVSSTPAAFGPATLSTAGMYDMFVTKLTDAGSTGIFVWAQQAGGTGTDQPAALAVSGATVYVAGYFDSPTANFGPATLVTAGANDAFVTKLTDAGPTGSFAGAQQSGGAGADQAYALAVSGTSVYVAGLVSSATASFGSVALANPISPNNLGFLASLSDPTLTATAPGRTRPSAQLFPNPAHGTATLHLLAGTAPAPLTLTDALGRTVRRYAAPAGPQVLLDLRGLPAGLYLLRGAGRAQRLLVE